MYILENSCIFAEKIDMYWMNDKMKEFLRSWEEEKNSVREEYFKRFDVPYLIEKNINGLPVIVLKH